MATARLTMPTIQAPTVSLHALWIVSFSALFRHNSLSKGLGSRKFDELDAIKPFRMRGREANG